MLNNFSRSQDAQSQDLTMVHKFIHFAGYVFYISLMMVMFCSFLSPWLAI